MDWNLLLSSFGLVFLAELGDKTQLAVVAQTCKFRRPFAVFLGASLALTASTALGVLGGRFVREFLPPGLLQTIAAAAFILMGLWMAIGLLRNGQSVSFECPPDGETANAACSPSMRWQAFAGTFSLIFLAELGDKTQLAVLSIAGQSQSILTVFVAGSLALSAVCGLGVIGGQGLLKLVPEKWILWLSAVAFVAMGSLMALGVL